MKIYIFLLVLISIIHIGGMVFRPLYEHFSITPNIVLLGDSILNNSNYVLSQYTVGNTIKKNYQKSCKIIVKAADNATITSTHHQLHTLLKQYPHINTSNTYIFLSVGGNDILQLSPSFTIKMLFQQYKKLVSTIKASFNKTHLRLVNIYYPHSPSYKKYYKDIEKWNHMLATYAKRHKLGIIMLDKNIKDKNDFVMDIEPSRKGAKIIAKMIIRNV